MSDELEHWNVWGDLVRSADYDIVIDGELDRSLASAFHPHLVQSDAGRTRIVGLRLDQAALLGILATATELALTLVSVERLDPVNHSTADHPPPP